MATNLVGSALARVALQVQWPPVLSSPGDEDLEVLQGVDHYFHCETDAKPRAKVSIISFCLSPVDLGLEILYIEDASSFCS